MLTTNKTKLWIWDVIIAVVNAILKQVQILAQKLIFRTSNGRKINCNCLKIAFTTAIITSQFHLCSRVQINFISQNKIKSTFWLIYGEIGKYFSSPRYPMSSCQILYFYIVLFIFKYHNNLLPCYFHTFFNVLSDIHSYNTRSAENQSFYLFKSRTNYDIFNIHF